MAKRENPDRTHSCRTKPSISRLTGPKTAIRAQEPEQAFGPEKPVESHFHEVCSPETLRILRRDGKPWSSRRVGAGIHRCDYCANTDTCPGGPAEAGQWHRTARRSVEGTRRVCFRDRGTQPWASTGKGGPGNLAAGGAAARPPRSANPRMDTLGHGRAFARLSRCRSMASLRRRDPTAKRRKETTCQRGND